MKIPGEYQKLVDQTLKIKKETQERLEEAILIFGNQFFSKYNEVFNFGWNQFTPFYEENGTCVFRVNTDPEHILINGFSKLCSHKPFGWNYLDHAFEVSEYLKQLEPSHLFWVYGDHVQIMVSKAFGIMKEDFIHE